MAILSVQSHVSYGHAGNSSAVFPLQRLGHVVWPVYTVLFSNHTGHGAWRGPILSGNIISDVIKGIFERVDYTQCDVMMTGYIGSVEIAESVIGAVKTIKQNHPDFIYSCDPVMGDWQRGFYTAKTIQEFFKHQMLDLFDIFLPNHFELAYLTDRKIESMNAAIESASSLIKRSGQVVIVTSLQFDSQFIHTLLVSSDGVYRVSTPVIALQHGFAGSGDLFHALFIGNYLIHRNLVDALERAVNAIYHLLQATEAQDSYELCIIPNQNYIVGNFPQGATYYQSERLSD